jgi:hypothetical protein
MSASDHLGKQFDGQVYRVPARFYEDHADRHDVHELMGRIVKTTGNYHHVRLTDSQVSNLHSDAEHYAGESPEYVDRGVISSARATKKALDKHYE